MPEHFHFLQPAWLFLLLPLAAMLWWMRRADNGSEDPWQKIIDKDLLPWLRVNNTASSSRLPLWLFASACLIAIIALANPVWQKLPQPVFQTDQARVIVLDLSLSMNSTDLKPARIDRARFKVRDILAQQQEGVIGLVVFAGDAFVVAPLTRDGDTIAAMLGALQPGIMPVQGSRADLGLLKAGELLQQAGRLRGEVLLLADSYSDQQTIRVAEELREQGIITSVLGIGTEQGAPLPSGRGDFLRDGDGQIITTRLDDSAMQELADAGGGDYVRLAADNSDIEQLLTERVSGNRHHSGADEQATRWKETGPWLAVLLLPLAALAFRRGWLLTTVLLVTTVVPVEPASAFSLQDLWERRDQQAHKALLEGDHERASQLATDPLRKGAAAYRKGDYEAALENFAAAAEAEGDAAAEAAYNKGNALAKMGRYADAIAAYDKALEKRSAMADARFNKEILEKLLQQQQDMQQQGEKQQGQQDGDQQQNQPGNAQSDPGQQQGDQADNQQGGQQESPEQAGSASGNEQKPGQNDENAFAKAAQQAAQQAAEQEVEEEATQPAQNAEQQNAQQQEMTAAEQGKQGSQHSSADNAQSNSESALQPSPSSAEKASAEATAEQLSSEEQLAAEQWLRRIPDDPAGLLRRKLRYQYIQRGGSSGKPDDQQPW